MDEQTYAERIAYERRLGLAQVKFLGQVAHADLGLNYLTGKPMPPTADDPTPIYRTLRRRGTR